MAVVADKPRRASRPCAKRDILDSSGGVIRAGEAIPRGALSTKAIDRLGAHGYIERWKGDDGIES